MTVRASTLRRLQGGDAGAAATAEQRLKELVKRNCQLAQGSEVLRRATGYVARDAPAR